MKILAGFVLGTFAISILTGGIDAKPWGAGFTVICLILGVAFAAWAMVVL